MITSKTLVLGAGGLVVLTGAVLGQWGPAPGGGNPNFSPNSNPSSNPSTMRRPNFAPDSSRANVELAAVKNSLRASAEEWKVIGPLLQDLVKARQALDTTRTTDAMGMGPPGGRGGMSNDAFGGPANTAAGNMGGRFGPGGRGEPGIRGPASQPGVRPPWPEGNFPDQPPPPPDNTAAPAPSSRESSPIPSAGNANARFDGMPRGSFLAAALADLQTTLADAQATDAQIHERLGVVRAARRKAQADVAAAESELRLLLTTDQEALLVNLGYLD